MDVFFIVAIKWKMILAVFVICFLYVSYNTAPKLMVNMLLFVWRFSFLSFVVFFFWKGCVCLMVNVESESLRMPDCGHVSQTHSVP